MFFLQFQSERSPDSKIESVEILDAAIEGIFAVAVLTAQRAACETNEYCRPAAETGLALQGVEYLGDLELTIAAGHGDKRQNWIGRRLMLKIPGGYWSIWPDYRFKARSTEPSPAFGTLPEKRTCY